MTAFSRLRLAAPVALIYWLMLGSGLLLYTALRADDALALVPLWAGAITGTLLGQLLAVGNYRALPALVIIAVVGFWMLPGYSGLVGLKPWVAVVPASLCGYWSLGERGALAAWWFPTMIWMLSILDTMQGGRSGGLDAILGCAVAASFILFLRVRESRRVALWCAVAATPLAVTRQPKVLREVPSLQLARAGWTVVTTGLTLVLTAWLAPMFWRAEAQQTTVVTTHAVTGTPQQSEPERPPHHEAVGRPTPLPYGGSVRYGAVRTRLPCCAVEEHVQVTRSRIKEYFDLGRGTDETEVLPHPHAACRVCRDDVAPPEDWTGGDVIAGTDGTWREGTERWWRPYPHQPVPQGRPELPDSQGEPSAQPWQPSGHPQLVQRYPQPQWQPDSEWQATAGRDPAIAARERSPYAGTASGTPIIGGPSAPTVTDQTADKPVPVAPSADKPTPASADKPRPSAAPAAPSPTADKPTPSPTSADKPAPAAAAAKPAPAAPATDKAAATAPTATAPVASAAVAKPATDVPASPVPTVVPPASPEKGLAVLHWLALLAAGGLIFQLVALALRPVRRLVTLRHLRRPFWDETVDQRVSNSWQLALVGLRDAGWRPTSTGDAIEPPREFAQRVGVDGVERCATILERARHGIGLDAADLSDMTTAAETAYRSAREKLGPGARAVALIRWPLA